MDWQIYALHLLRLHILAISGTDVFTARAMIFTTAAARLRGRLDHGLVLLELGSNRHVHVFIANGDDEPSDDGWVHLVRDLALFATL